MIFVIQIISLKEKITSIALNIKIKPSNMHHEFFPHTLKTKKAFGTTVLLTLLNN